MAKAKPDTKRLLDPALIPDVLETGKDLREAVTEFRRTTLAASPEIWLPPSFDCESHAPIDLAVDALCRMEYDDSQGKPVPLSGLIAATPEIVDAAERVNEKKQKFKTAVAALRASMRDAKEATHRLVELVASGPMKGEDAKRDVEFARALRNMGFARFDLVSCYRQIRVLEPHVDTVSYTWQRDHGEITQVPLARAIQMAEKLENDEVRERTIHTLSGYSNDTVFAYRHGCIQQLRANVTNLKGGKRVRKVVVCSGVLLVRGPIPDRVVWRDLERDMGDKLPRYDASVSPEPCIEVLSLYEYLKPPKDAAKRSKPAA